MIVNEKNQLSVDCMDRLGRKVLAVKINKAVVHCRFRTEALGSRLAAALGRTLTLGPLATLNIPTVGLFTPFPESSIVI